MKILGFILCGISFFLSYKRLMMVIFGQSAGGEIIGYAPAFGRARGVVARPYLIRFQVGDEIYTGRALESALGSNTASFSEKNLYREVTVFFREENPESVTIKEFKQIYVVSLLFFALGAAGLFL